MSSETGSSPSPPGTLGEFLRQEREKRGITIEQVASATKISVRLLQALETSQFHELPAKPFIRGFVTSYCRFIQLEPKAVLRQFDSFISERLQDRPSRESGHTGYAFERKEIERSKTLLWTVMASFIVVGGVLLLLLKPSLKHHRHSALDKLKAGATPASIPTPEATFSSSMTTTTEPIPTTTTTAPPEKKANTEPKPENEADPLNSGTTLKRADIKHKIIIKALADVWVRYRCDQRPEMKFILRKDRILVLRGTEIIRFQASNAKAVTYNYNARGAKPLSAFSKLIQQNGAPSAVFPIESAETAGELFPGQSSLPATSDPSSP